MARAAKDSGIEWIGEIPEDWVCSNIGKFYQIQLGKMLQPTQLNKDDTFEHYLCSVNIYWDGVRTEVLKQMWFSKQEREKYYLKKGDLLVTEGGDVGVACLWNEEVGNCYIQNALHKVSELGMATNTYLYYWLFVLKTVGYIDLICNKATISHFTKDKFSKSIFILPPLVQQQSIVDCLDRKCNLIDGTIEKQNSVIERLKLYKQSIINEAVTKGLDPTAKMKPSGIEWIGEIPKHWKIAKLKKISRIIGDGLHGTPIYSGEGSFYFINGNNLGDRFIRISSVTNRIAETEYAKYKISLDMNTLLISLNGTIGNMSFYNGEPIMLSKSSGYIKLETDLEKSYIYYFLQCEFVKRYFGLSFSGTTINNLSLETLRNTPITLPQLSEQQAIADHLDTKCSQIDTIITGKQKLLEKLTAYKKSLIYECVTGKREVV